jgi:hypothetical protein
MQKHAIVRDVQDHIQIAPAPSAREAAPGPALRLATDDDVGVVGPARQLQRDLAKALASERGWTVRRTVVVGAVFHVAVLGSLVLAAGGMIPQLVH